MAKRKPQPNAQTDKTLPYAMKKDGERGEIAIYDVIGSNWFDEGVTAKQFVKDLKALGKVKAIDVRINSPGGSVFEGYAIYNALKQHTATIDVHIDGMAFSMGSVIAMAGDSITMAPTAMMMVHNPQGGIYGDMDDIIAYADMMQKVAGQIADMYAQRTGKSVEDVREIMAAETWFTPEEALDAGFITAIAEDTNKIAAMSTFDVVASCVEVPEVYRARVQALSREVPKVSEEKKEPATGQEQTPAPVAATVDQLEALRGADSDFVLSQLKTKATLESAMLALNAKLADAADAAIKALQAKQEGGLGGDPVGTGRKQDSTTEQAGHDYRIEMRRLMSEGLNAVEASARIRRERPELVAAFV